METPTIVCTKKTKHLHSDTYKYIFRYEDGHFMRWGKSIINDPEYSPFGPEILDIEISTICHKACKHCYKSNTSIGENMSFETFKTIFHKIPKTLTQIAFGVGSIDANPDFVKMLKYCRENTYNMVIPNLTINGYRMTPEWYDTIATLCGACSVSRYGDGQVCYNAIKELKKRGMKQVNIHQILAKETFADCVKLLVDYKNNVNDLRDDVNAIVFLALKEKGDTNEWHSLRSTENMKTLLDMAISNKLNIGFDSCNGPTVLKIAQENEEYKKLESAIDPCESLRFSLYINSEGKVYPCSFCEGNDNYKNKEIDMLKVQNFIKEVWYSDMAKEFRKKLTDGCNKCPEYQLYDF